MFSRLQQWLLAGILEELSHIRQQLNQLEMKQSELAATLNTVKDTLSKAKTEILAKIEALSSSDPDISPEGQQAIEQLKAVATALDDVVPDATEA